MAPSRDTEPGWGAVAHRLAQVEASESWRRTAGSFTEWIAAEAARHEKKSAWFWRALSAGRYYNELRASLAETSRRFPPLEQVREPISPEALELLEKLSRVAPTSLISELTLKVMEGDMPRERLREHWLAFRDVLGGRTARGRSGKVPKFNPRDARMVAERAEANCVAHLVESQGAWLGEPGPIACRIHQVTQRQADPCPDVIALVRRSSSADVEIHGIEVRATARIPEWIYALQDDAIDYLWIALPFVPNAAQLKAIQPGVGVIACCDRRVHLVREANARAQSKSRSSPVYRLLLRQLV